MKNIKLFILAAGVAFAASCTKMDDILPEGSRMLESQVQATYAANPERSAAPFAAMFTGLGKPAKLYSNPDDWQFLMILFCNDLEGADALIADSGYNWFSVCGELSSRNANYRNPYIRYRTPYNLIADVNTFISGFGEDVTDPMSINRIAQSKVLRAFAYLNIAPYYQFNYQFAKDEPCVPIVTPKTEDFTHNPRATVGEVYAAILNDLDEAIEVLDNSSIERVSKAYIDGQVAHGLRARTYLEMGEYAKALADAEAAAAGYTPATLAEVSVPSFKSIDEHNWMWGYAMTPEMAARYPYATTSSWLRSFSANGYAPACQVYTQINTLLYDKISDSDIRKQWWVDENLESTLLDGLKWPGFDDVAHADDGGDAKLPYLPYTNVKFGCNTVGTVNNDEDFPFMRVEEMILIQVECLAQTGKKEAAIAMLEDFVKTNRDPEYSVDDRGLSLLDEIWFQRRVELWGEGFFNRDMRRLKKPLVRFHDENTNMPEAFRFNLPADDPWLLLRFPQTETDTNFSVVDNEGGHQPKIDENPNLRDGVTD